MVATIFYRFTANSFFKVPSRTGSMGTSGIKFLKKNIKTYVDRLVGSLQPEMTMKKELANGLESGWKISPLKKYYGKL